MLVRLCSEKDAISCHVMASDWYKDMARNKFPIWARLRGALRRCSSLVWFAPPTALGAPCIASHQACPNRELISDTFLSSVLSNFTNLCIVMMHSNQIRFYNVPNTASTAFMACSKKDAVATCLDCVDNLSDRHCARMVCDMRKPISSGNY